MLPHRPLVVLIWIPLLASVCHAQPDSETIERLREVLPSTQFELHDEPSELASALVTCLAYDAQGQIVDGTQGIVVEEGLVLAPLLRLVDAHSIMVRAACCEERPADGIIAFDTSLGLAYISAPGLEADAYPGTFAPIPSPLPEKVRSVCRLPFQIEGAEGTATLSADIQNDWQRHTYPRTLIVDLPFDTLGAGALLFTEEGEPCAMTLGWAGLDNSGASPISDHSTMTLLDTALTTPDQLFEHCDSDEARAIIMTQRASNAARFSPADGLPLADQAVRLDPSNPAAWYELGVMLDKTGKKTRAIDALIESTTLNGTWCESQYSLGLVQLKSDQPDEAIESFKRAVDADSRHADAHAMMGVAYLNAGNNFKAVRSMRAAINERPDDLQFTINLAIALEQSGREEEVPETWHSFAKATPDDPDLWYIAIVQSIRSGQYHMLDPIVTEAVNLHGDKVDMLGAVAFHHMLNDEPEQARINAEEALENDPDDYLGSTVIMSLDARGD